MVIGKRLCVLIFAYKLLHSNVCRTAKSCVNRYFMLLLHIFPQSYPHSVWITLWESTRGPNVTCHIRASCASLFYPLRLPMTKILRISGPKRVARKSAAGAIVATPACCCNACRMFMVGTTGMIV